MTIAFGFFQSTGGDTLAEAFTGEATQFAASISLLQHDCRKLESQPVDYSRQSWRDDVYTEQGPAEPEGVA